MAYLEDPEAYNVTTSREYAPPMMCPPRGGSSVVWIIFLIIAILIIAALVGLIIWFWLRHRNDGKGKVLTILNPNIQVNSDNSITGTWTSTTNSNDTVVLSVTTQPPLFASGTGATGGHIINSDVRSSQPSSSGSVTLTGLQPALKYYATLVVTNPSLTNTYASYTQLVFMSSDFATLASTTTNFAIEHILQVGKLQARNDTVIFSQEPTDANALWRYGTADTFPNRLVNISTNQCLYADASNSLRLTDCAINSGSTGTNANSTWTYNPGSLANRWCLANTINAASSGSGATGAVCMVLGNITAASSNAPGFANVTVSNNSRAGDAWVNAFENPPA